jgi:hypothetical protein
MVDGNTAGLLSRGMICAVTPHAKNRQRLRLCQVSARPSNTTPRGANMGNRLRYTIFALNVLVAQSMAVGVYNGLPWGLVLFVVGLIWGGVGTAWSWGWYGAVIVGLAAAVLKAARLTQIGILIIRLELRNVRALELVEKGQLEKALQLAKEDYDLARRTLGENVPVPRVRYQTIQARVLWHKGDHRAALIKQQELLRFVEHTKLPLPSGTVTNVISDLGIYHLELGEYEPALHWLQKALEETRKLKGEDNADFVVTLTNLS